MVVRKTKSNKAIRPAWLLLFLALEVIVLGTFWITLKHSPEEGFLIKNGPSFVLAWKNEEGELEARSYNRLSDAIEYAGNSLGLKAGPNQRLNDSLEMSWLRQDIGKYTLYWKTARHPYVHRLTFQREDEARFFELAFKQGSYSTSPWGHSIFFNKSSVQN